MGHDKLGDDFSMDEMGHDELEDDSSRDEMGYQTEHTH
jgi:hypothetical protein